jgi:CHAT domain-containing protein
LIVFSRLVVIVCFAALSGEAPAVAQQESPARLAAEAAALLESSKPADLEQARAKYEALLAIRVRADDRQGQADATYGMAAALEKLFRRTDARRRYLEALDLFEALGDDRGRANAALNAGVLSYVVGEPAKALPLLERALGFWQRVGDPRGEARTCSNIGVVHYALGDLPAAIDWYNRALPLRRAAGDKSGEAGTLHNIGLVYNNLGEPQQALDQFARALEVVRGSGDRRAEMGILTTIGQANLTLGDPERAAGYFSQVLAGARAGNLDDQVAQALEALGQTSAALGRPEEALKKFQEALADYRRIQYQRGEAGVIERIARIYDRLGRTALALEHMQQSAAMFATLREPASHAQVLAAVGDLHARLGRHQPAREALSAALATARHINNPGIEIAALTALATLDRDAGDLAGARANLEAATIIVESRRAKLANDELRAGYLATQRRAFESHVDVLMRMHEQSPAESFAAGAFEISERARARALLDLLAEARVDVRDAVDPALKRREQEIDARASRFQRRLIRVKSSPSPDAAEIASLEQALTAVERERRDLESQIRAASPRYAQLRAPETMTADLVRSTLDQQTVLLEYLIGDEHSFLFVISADSVTALRLPGASAAAIARLVADTRASVSQPGRARAASYVSAARRLYQLLIEPAAPAIAGRRHLLIAPDRDLHYLPFEILLSAPPASSVADFAAHPYLIRRWAVSYTPSATVWRDLTRLARRPKGDTAFVGFGDAVYLDDGRRVSDGARSLFDANGRLTLSRLEGSRDEVTRLAKRFPADGARVYLGRDSREGNVKNNAIVQRAERLHFAVHGLIDERRPQYSGLVMSLDGDPEEDGLLQVHEIFNLKLNAGLVVLSACGSGLGRQITGEGVLGLSRAFLYAGASSLAVSLWQVADRSTADLMAAFYAGMTTASRAIALQRAKLQSLGSSHASHPYYWAPFILIGD